MPRARAIVSVTLLGLVLAASAAWWLWRAHVDWLNTPMPIGAESQFIIVEPGDTIQRVARALDARGLLEHPYSLIAHARLSGKGSEIKAGEFAIAPGTTPAAFLDRLVAGRVVQHSLTLIEGWTFRDVRRAIEADDRLRIQTAGLEDAEVMAMVGAPGEHPEGRFLVDTYHFPRGTTDTEFLRRALRAMDRYLDEAWSSREPDLPLETPYQALTLASIVEKETGVPEERPRIAGVFISRLRRNMRLETDPTVIYGMGERFDGNIRKKDLRTDTPYNTYVHKGLPPTPIAMPSRRAIDAVLHPEVDGALFFVARGDGSHHFSRTYAEHREAVRKYQLRRSTRRTSRSGD